MIYYALRSPWIVSTAAGIAALFIAQQAVMAIRAFFKLGFWGAEVTAFRELEEPELCRLKKTTGPIEVPGASMPETHEVVGVSEARELRVTQ